MKYFFVLGRNPLLSYAEIVSYLKNRQIAFQKIYFKENLLVLEISSDFKINVNNLGGTVFIGEIKFEGTEQKFSKFLSDWFIDEQKFSYSLVGNYKDKAHEILDLKFKREKAKAIFKGASKKIILQNGSYIDLPKADFIYFYLKLENEIFFGRVTQEYSSSEVKFRDMKKPFRREELAISPRLAKILINLSGALEGKTMLDPFCGVGVFLQEAVLLNMNVIGVDIDKTAIEQAKANLVWLQENFSKKFDYSLIRTDSKKLDNVKFDCIATEPNLGELVTRKMSDKESQDFIEDFEIFIVPILRNLKKLKKENGKIAIIFPRTRNVSVNIQNVLRETGLKMCKIEEVEFPIREYRSDSRVEREIILLE